MKFSIVTPSFRQLSWLELNIASVADQFGASSENSIEHLIQDAGTAGIAEFASRMQKRFSDRPNYQLRFAVESDMGMYDGVNRGLRRATGDVCGYLNCDEQYLPGALQTVTERFLEDSDLDILFGSVVIVDANLRYVCSRRVITPQRLHTLACHLATFTAATFFRSALLSRHNLFFDAERRADADASWVLTALERGLRSSTTKRFLAVFADTGENLDLDPTAVTERKELARQRPLLRRLSPVLAAHHRLRKWHAGAYNQKPFTFDLHTLNDPFNRQSISVTRPTEVWRSRLK